MTLWNVLIKIGRDILKAIYNDHNPVGFKLLTRLRLVLSHLNQHKFNHNFQDCLNPLCSVSLEVESFPFLSALSLLHKHTFNPLKWVKINWYKLVETGRWYSSRTGCPKGLEKLERLGKGLIFENGLEKLEKHILFIVLRLEKVYFGHKACLKETRLPVVGDCLTHDDFEIWLRKDPLDNKKAWCALCHKSICYLQVVGEL